MGNLIVIAVLLCIVGGAVCYLVQAKKQGRTCIGCPHAGQCKKRT